MNDTSPKTLQWLCFGALSIVLLAVQLVGQRALHQGKIRPDLADEMAYFNAAQDYVMVTKGSRVEYLWEVLHSFKTAALKHKEPGTQLASVPIILAQGGVHPTTLRMFGFLWMIPSAIFLYWGLVLLANPVSALLGSLLFVLAPTTLVTFSHWYQEITAIPAVCAAIAAGLYEAKYGHRNNWGWILSGAVWGLGMYTKISFVFILIWMWATLFVLAEWMDNTANRRKRLLQAGFLTYFIASFWWPTHFTYVARYVTASGYVKHGTASSNLLDRFALFFRSDFLYGVGYMGTLLVLCAGLAFLVGLMWRSIPRWRRERPSAICLLCLSGIVSIILIDVTLHLKTAISFPLKLGCVLLVAILLRHMKANQPRSQLQPVTTALVMAIVPFLLIYVQRAAGNNFNPRLISVVIPLAGCFLAFALDRLTSWKRGYRMSAVLAGILLTIQGYWMVTSSSPMPPDGDSRFIRPFSPDGPSPIDYGVLQTVAPLPVEDQITIGFVGVGPTFTVHAIKRGYFPDTHRVDVVNLSPISSRNLSITPLTIMEIVEGARKCDYVLIPEDIHESVDYGESKLVAKDFFELENQMNMPLVEALSASENFDGPVRVQAKPGTNPSLLVFRNTLVPGK